MKSFLDSLPDNRLFMKNLQYRYNHDTKLSQIKGFISPPKTYLNDLNMQGWRTIPLSGGGLAPFFHFKFVKYGILIDLCSCMMEVNDATGNPTYPDQCTYTLTEDA